MDKLDLRILSELDNNCRTPLSTIGKLISKSPQYVKYRFEKLINDKIIRNVSFIQNLTLNQTEIIAFISLKGTQIIEEQKLLDFIFKLSQTNKLYYCDGDSQIVCSFIIEKYDEIQQIKEMLYSNFSIIDNINLNTIMNTQIYNKKFLFLRKSSKIINIEKKDNNKEELKSKVLKQIKINPFTSLLELGFKINVSYEKIKYLFKTNPPYIATRLIFSDTCSSKGFLLLEFKNEHEDLINYCRVCENIIQVEKIIGNYNYLISFETLKDKEISKIVKELIYRFNKSIEKYKRIDVLKTLKVTK